MAKERFVNVRRRGFTTIENAMLDDPNLSLQAKGLLSIFLSNKNDWEINMKEIITRSKNGRDAHYKVVKELIEQGYFYRFQVIEKGKFKEMVYIFSDVKEDVQEAVKQYEKQGLLPHPENQETVNEEPLPENPDTEKPDTENQDNNNTKGNNTNTNNTNSMYVGNHPTPDVFDLYTQNYNKMTKYTKEQLTGLKELHGDLLVREALKRAIKSETDTPISYIKGVLKKWSAAGVQTLEDIEAYERKFREEQQKKKASKTPAKKEKKLPKSVQKAMNAQPVQPDQQDDEPLEVKQARIQAKLKLMNEKLAASRK